MVALVFLYRAIADVLRTLFRKGRPDVSLIALLLALVFVLAVVFFNSDPFFKTTSVSVTFWMGNVQFFAHFDSRIASR